MNFVLLFALALTPPKTVVIPFELQGDVIFVKAYIGSAGPLDMALDSGTVRTTIDEPAAAAAGLDLSIKARSSGANGVQEISVLKDQNVRVGEAEAAEPVVLAYPLAFLSKALGRHVDGIIGVELFRKHVVEIDYATRTLRISDPAGFSYTGKGQAVPVICAGRLPVVAGSITPFGREPIPTAFQLDTGAAGVNVAFWKAFVDKHDLAAGMHDVMDVQATSFGGSHPAKTGRLQALQVGGVTVAEPFVRLNPFGYGDASVFGGNLGARFFQRFKVIFDLPHDRLILE